MGKSNKSSKSILRNDSIIVVVWGLVISDAHASEKLPPLSKARAKRKWILERDRASPKKNEYNRVIRYHGTSAL